MKVFNARTTAALATLLALGACGGKASFDINGTVSGLNNPGLVLVNNKNGDEVNVPAGVTTFKFPKSIDYGTEYNVTLKANPSHQSCTVGNGSGSAGHLASVTVAVICTQNAYTIGGVLTGPIGDGTVVLINGSTGGQVSVTKDALNFTFATPVADGTPYGVAVLSQPANLSCTVANGSDIMGESPRNNIVVTCVAK
ncbi:hypothetical protein [Pseudoduganella namucuonensis]|uniref:Lipoprotein n=1 Tax=Pseudoduganella namucuonensis TaxID=1035707 RepID=A0A1I7M175_9BURK|nr:hypothetical protein [Pseudoduganella namucuonensis]SFV15686.1 hypothetical protein SAMN05216552_104741 [Pseudoduganella namucuonensis]